MQFPSLLDSAVGMLAVWRVSALIAYERGPWAVFQRIREAAGIKHFDDGSPDTDNLNSELAKFLSCVWCISPYIGLIWLGFYLTEHDFTMILSYILALSAGSIIVERINHG